MKRLLILIALIVLVVFGLGAYLDWFDLSSRNEEGNADVTLTLDKDKVEADKDRVVDRVDQLRDKGAEKLAAPGEEAGN